MASLVTVLLAGLQLEWVAPPECGERAEFEALVTRWAPGDSQPLTSTVSINRSGPTFVLVLEAVSGRRELRSERCEEVTRGAALVLAMLLLEDRRETPVAVSVTPPPPVLPDPPRWSGAVRAAALIDLGGLPSPSPGARATVGVRREALLFELGLAMFLGQQVPLPSPAGATAIAVLDFDVTARGCWLPGAGRVRARLCPAISMGRLSATGMGLSAPQTSHSLVAVAFAGLGLLVELPFRLGLVGHVELGVPLVRSAIGSAGQPAVFTTPWLAARTELGLEWRWP